MTRKIRNATGRIGLFSGEGFVSGKDLGAPFKTSLLLQWRD